MSGPAGAAARARRASSPTSPGEVYLEFLQFAGAVRVVAVDAATGIEVTVMAPCTAAREDVERIAVRKLQRRLECPGPDTPRETRGGLLA